jgi:hypothetical protein
MFSYIFRRLWLWLRLQQTGGDALINRLGVNIYLQLSF